MNSYSLTALNHCSFVMSLLICRYFSPYLTVGS